MSWSCRVAVWMFVGASAAAGRANEPTVDFNRDIRPILAKKCFACHGPDEEHREAGLRLDAREVAVKQLESGATALVPGASGKSELARRLAAVDDSERMPPKETGITLTEQQIGLLKRWIDEGASYAPHWAMVKPVRPSLPEVKHKDWPQNGIDYFALARLERRVARLVSLLASEDLLQREQAEAELASLGRPALASIRRALEAAPDDETRMRLERTVRTLTTVRWRTDLAAALEASRATGKPLLVYSTIGIPTGYL